MNRKTKENMGRRFGEGNGSNRLQIQLEEPRESLTKNNSL